MNPDIWFAGDPHGDFRQLTRYALKAKPDAVVILGDLELPAPLEEVFYPLLRAGIIVRGIHGNHDADDEGLWRRIADGAFAETWNLHGRVESICGVRIGGLGGVFRGKVWYPPDEPVHESYEEFERKLVPWWWNAEERERKKEWGRNQLLTHRGTIFPDEYERLAQLEADVLVTHEAPGRAGMHPHGHKVIDDLGELVGARKAFHGHHQEAVEYPKSGECQWTSVGFREIVDLNGNRITL